LAKSIFYPQLRQRKVGARELAVLDPRAIWLLLRKFHQIESGEPARNKKNGTC
jgi:hypothetical protein